MAGFKINVSNSNVAENGVHAFGKQKEYSTHLGKIKESASKLLARVKRASTNVLSLLTKQFIDVGRLIKIAMPNFKIGVFVPAPEKAEQRSTKLYIESQAPMDVIRRKLDIEYKQRIDNLGPDPDESNLVSLMNEFRNELSSVSSDGWGEEQTGKIMALAAARVQVSTLIARSLKNRPAAPG